jgi:hypothetical protein
MRIRDSICGRTLSEGPPPVARRRQTRLARALLILGLAAWPAAFLADRILGVEVTLLARMRTPAERAAWRAAGWDPRDGVAELYGIVEPPAGLRVIVLDRDRLVRPPEDPSLVLLAVDRARGDDPLPGRALQWRAALAGAALALCGLLLLVLPRYR